MKRRIGELSNLQFALLFTLPVILFLVVIVAYPLLYAAWMSLHAIRFFGGYSATFVGFDHFATIWSTPEFWRATWVSLRFTVESVVLSLGFGLAIALILAQRFPASGVVKTIAILPWAVSIYAVGIMFSYFWRSGTGFVSAIANLVGDAGPVAIINANNVVEILALGHAWHLAPLVAFFLLANLQSIPERLYDLADLDKQGVFGKFYYVTLPYLRYTLFVFTCVTTVLSLKVFDYMFVMTGGGPGASSTTLTYRIYQESFRNLNLGYGAAMSFYLLILIVGTTILLFLIWGRREAER
jgi:ABC-type sugar transport system permease subunit